MATKDQEAALDRIIIEVVHLPHRHAIEVLKTALEEVQAAAAEYEKRLGY